MTNKERIEGNELIADFLDWPVSYKDDNGYVVYHVPNNFKEDTGEMELNTDGFMFDSDWNWLHFVWNKLHRDVLIPTLKMNPHLRREINDMVKDMRSSLKWSHIEGSFKVLVRIIKWYDTQFSND
jgi:hypothetical protein